VEDSGIFVDVFLPLALALIMITLGLSLAVDDFKRVVKYPKGVGIGMVNLALISPLLAFGMAELFNLDPLLATGLVLLGASPGGTMANMLTHLARGDTALSVTMTAISSVAAIITVPLFLGLAGSHFGVDESQGLGDMLDVVARVLFIAILPLGLGMYIRSRDPERIAEIEPRAKKLGLVLFLGVVIGAVVSEWDRVWPNVDDVALACIALNLAAMTVSYAIARVAKLDDRQSTAIAIELGVHNAVLAIAIGSSISEELTIPAAVYSSFMFISAGLFARLMYRRNAGAEGAA